MANTARARGAMPKGKALRTNKYVAGGTVYPGDFVKMDANGKVIACTGSTTAETPTGVAAQYQTTGLDVLVWDHPDQLFIVQSDDVTEPAALTACNLNYTITATTGSTTFKQSKQTLDGSTGATNSNYPLKLLDIEASPNNAYGGYADCIVCINAHALKTDTGAVGI